MPSSSLDKTSSGRALARLRSPLAKLTAAVCERLAAAPPTRQWRTVTLNEPGGFGYDTETRLDLVMASLGAVLHRAPSLADLADHVDRDRDLGAFIWSPRPADFPADQWIDQVLVRHFLYAYVREANAARFDDAAFARTFDLLAREALDDHRPVVALVPLSRVQLAVPVVELSPSVRLRRLTGVEIERWMNPEMWTAAPPVDAMDIPQSRVAIEIATLPVAGRAPHLEIVTKALAIVRLGTSTDVAARFVSMRWPTRPMGSSEYFFLPRPVQPGVDEVIDEPTAERLRTYWNRAADGPNGKLVDLALTRWSAAADRESDDDRLIDYWISLESLFTSADATTEVTFRAALRIAAWLGGPPDRIQETFEDIQRSYDWRSAVVHAASNRRAHLEKKHPLKDIAARTRDYVRDSLLKILDLDVRFEANKIEVTLLRRSATP